jgi:hypothetical protein
MTGTFVWAPERLNAAILRAYEESLVRAAVDAKAHSPDPDKAGVELVGNTLKPTGLGTVFEQGRRGGYDIQPKDKLAIKFPDGSFATFAKGGAMAAKPYLGPAGVRWANGGFQSTARASLASQGF